MIALQLSVKSGRMELKQVHCCGSQALGLHSTENHDVARSRKSSFHLGDQRATSPSLFKAETLSAASGEELKMEKRKGHVRGKKRLIACACKRDARCEIKDQGFGIMEGEVVYRMILTLDEHFRGIKSWSSSVKSRYLVCP